MDSHPLGPVGRSGMARCLRLAALAACAIATGCTMCPDPFDYSGPVPNGSVTQNDFAARSNGNRPVRATPLPWPPIVDSSRRQPTPAEEPGAPRLVAAEEPADAEDRAPEAAVAVLPEAESQGDTSPPAAAVDTMLPPTTVPEAAIAVAETGVTAPADAPVTVRSGVVPPRGAWMTRSRRLPPPGNVTPPAERDSRRPPAEPDSTWRQATRSLLAR